MHCTICKTRRENPVITHATHRLWCPTWVNADEGPMDLCDEHANNFKPEHNPHSKDGEFFWGKEADLAFRTVRQFIRRQKSPEIFGNAWRMLDKAKRISGGNSFSAVFIVDGEVWIRNMELATHLGNMDDVRVIFPKLLIAH